MSSVLIAPRYRYPFLILALLALFVGARLSSSLPAPATRVPNGETANPLIRASRSESDLRSKNERKLRFRFGALGRLGASFPGRGSSSSVMTRAAPGTGKGVSWPMAGVLGRGSEKVRGMSDGSACPHGGGNQGRFRQLRVTGTGLAGCLVVQLDAVGALRG
jgi:hypothetical protein